MPRLHMLTPLALALSLLAAACGGPGATPVPTATPTATPTPTAPPLAAAPFLDLKANATVGDVLQRLPQKEQNCIKQQLTDAQYQQLVKQPAFESNDSSPFSISVDPSCLSSKTITGLFVASISQRAGGLSTQTMQCMESAINSSDLITLLKAQGTTATPAPAQVGDIFGAMAPLLLCLDDQEASRIDLGQATGGTAPAITLQNLRCLLQRVDVNVLTQFFTMAESQTSTPSPQEMQQLAQITQAMQACGIQTTGAPGTDFPGLLPSPTP